MAITHAKLVEDGEGRETVDREGVRYVAPTRRVVYRFVADRPTHPGEVLTHPILPEINTRHPSNGRLIVDRVGPPRATGKGNRAYDVEVQYVDILSRSDDGEDEPGRTGGWLWDWITSEELVETIRDRDGQIVRNVVGEPLDPVKIPVPKIILSGDRTVTTPAPVELMLVAGKVNKADTVIDGQTWKAGTLRCVTPKRNKPSRERDPDAPPNAPLPRVETVRLEWNPDGHQKRIEERGLYANFEVREWDAEEERVVVTLKRRRIKRSDVAKWLPKAAGEDDEPDDWLDEAWPLDKDGKVADPTKPPLYATGYQSDGTPARHLHLPEADFGIFADAG